VKHVRIDSPAVAHGVGLFETMLVERGDVAFLDAHLARMTRSSAALGFPPPDGDAFRNAALEAAGDAGGEAALRMLWIDGGDDGWILSAQTRPIPPRTLSRRERGRAITLDASLTRALPEHKTTSYAPCVIGLRRAAEADADEGIFVARDGGVLEGTATNIFAVRDRTLITAASGILPGIVRAWALAEAHAIGLSIEERCPTVDELRAGSFFTSSLTRLAPIRQIDGMPCNPPGEVFAELQRRWHRTA
jgi:branched-subunit amino acid aminotransferase/4-amino-4-deoxychorismate lyase